MRIYYPLGTKNTRYKTRQRITTSIMGFQAINGHSIAYFPKRSNTYFFLHFLLRVVLANTENPHLAKKIIDIIDDNYHSEEAVTAEFKRRKSKEHIKEFKNNYTNYMINKNGKEPTYRQIERKTNSYKRKLNLKNKTLLFKICAKRLLSIIKSDEELIKLLIQAKPIIMVLDNCKIHSLTITLTVANYLNIDLRFLPKYSPQFNPIEQVWRSIKREISYHIIKSRKQLQKLIYKAYKKIIKNKSYYEKWVKKYILHK